MKMSWNQFLNFLETTATATEIEQAENGNHGFKWIHTFPNSGPRDELDYAIQRGKKRLHNQFTHAVAISIAEDVLQTFYRSNQAKIEHEQRMKAAMLGR